MSQRKFPITEALANNNDVVTSLMTGAQYTDYAVMPSLTLPRTIAFRGRTFTHVTVNSFLTGDSPWRDRPHELVPLSPALSFMLQERPDAKKGLVTRLDYAAFGLDAEYFDRVVPQGLGAMLLPRSFEIGRGENFDDPDTVLAAGALGSGDDRGPVARVAAETIQVTSELIRGVGFQALAAQHDY